MEIKVECKVEDCWIHHDMENEVINEKAREYAELIEDAVSNRQIFCNCNVEKYVISLKAERNQKFDCTIKVGCPHFKEQMVKGIYNFKVAHNFQ